MIIIKDGKEYDYKISRINIDFLNGVYIQVDFSVSYNNQFVNNYGMVISGDQATNIFTKWCAEKDIYSILKEGTEDIELRNKIWKIHNEYIKICDEIRVLMGIPATQIKLSTDESKTMLNQLEGINPLAAMKYGLLLLAAINEVNTVGSTWYNIIWHSEVEE